jgi:hypothetical protein
MKVSPAQTNFNSGEISPLMYGRTDIDNYKNGLDTCLNFIPLVQGGITSRPGTYFAAKVKNSAKATRIIRFEFSTTQAYVIEIGDLYMRFFKNEAQIESSPGVPYEVVTPYAAADTFQLKFAQSADVLYIAHPTYAPATLSRVSDTNWSLDAYVSTWGPFLEENLDPTYLIKASASTGVGITLTASGTGNTPFTASHVGALWSFRELLASSYNKWVTATSYSSNAYVHYSGRLYQTSAGGTSGTRPPIHESGTESDGTVSWTFVRIDRGYVRITAFTSSTVVTATVLQRLPDSALAGSGIFRWSEGAWSPARGYPGAVIFYEDRLSWAGSLHKPQTIWMSVSSEYTNFTSVEPDGTVADDNALILTLNADDVNAIRWLADEERALLAGTVGGDWTIRPSSQSEALTPTNVLAKRSTGYGTANIQALRAGRATVYVQKSGRKLRELAYVYEIDGFRAPDMTVISEHITQSGIKDMAFQQEPQSIIWCTRNDGVLVGLTYEREQKVIGWHRHELGGTDVSVESVAAIPAPAGDRDQLWLVVKRIINGAEVRTIEFLQPLFEHGVTEQEDAFFVDCGMTYDGSAATTITGLDHLEGETVAILADGATHPDRVVSAGAITLARSASVVQVGLQYYRDLRTLPIDAGSQDGTSQAKTKRIHRVALRLLSTLGITHGPRFDSLTRVVFRTSSDDSGVAPPLYSGDVSFTWEGGYETEGYVCLRCDQPLPCTILAIYPQLVTQDRG